MSNNFYVAILMQSTIQHVLNQQNLKLVNIFLQSTVTTV